MQGYSPRRGQVVAGKYRIVRPLGMGSRGAVYEAENVLTSRRVALKWLLPHLAGDPTSIERMRREAQAAARIRHPNVVDVYDVERIEQALVLVMEYLEGESLALRLKRGRLPVREAIAVVADVAHGVAAAHAQAILHRDIKPANVFLAQVAREPRPVPKLLDFGIAKRMAEAGGSQHDLTGTGIVVGTPAYMAPEQLRGEELDERADVYALGVVLYEALAGKQPFEGDTLLALVQNIQAGAPVPVGHLRPELPAKVAAVVMRTIRQDRTRRPRSAAELVSLLEPFARDETASRRVAKGQRRPRWVRTIPLWLTGGVALALYAARGDERHHAEQRPSAVVPPLPSLDAGAAPVDAVDAADASAAASDTVNAAGTLSSATPPNLTPLALARECLLRGDQRCAVLALEGRAESPTELALLIETYRALGEPRTALEHVRTFVARYPSHRHAAGYRALLEEEARTPSRRGGRPAQPASRRGSEASERE